MRNVMNVTSVKECKKCNYKNTPSDEKYCLYCKELLLPKDKPVKCHKEEIDVEHIKDIIADNHIPRTDIKVEVRLEVRIFIQGTWWISNREFNKLMAYLPFNKFAVRHNDNSTEILLRSE